MCGLSKAELPDVFVTAPDRQNGEPSSASFSKTDVRTLIEGFPNANIEIALNDSGEDPNLEMWAIDENNIRVNGPIIAEFPCPRRCFDQHGILLPGSLFCNRDLQTVLDHDGSNYVVIHYGKKSESLCLTMYPAKIDIQRFNTTTATTFIAS